MYRLDPRPTEVFEPFAYGGTCVVTPFAHRGYERVLPPNLSIGVGRTPREFAAACGESIADAGQRDREAERGREVMLDRISFKRFASVVKETLAEVLEEDAAPRNHA